MCFWRCGSAESGVGKNRTVGSISGSAQIHTHTHAHVHVATHLWVQLSSAFIDGLLSSQAINDFGIIQFTQSLVLQPLPLLSFGLLGGNSEGNKTDYLKFHRAQLQFTGFSLKWSKKIKK